MTRDFAARLGRVTVGLAVSRDFVRGVAVKRDRILWATVVERNGEPLQATIERALAGSPLPRWPRAFVVAAVGPSSSQTKPLARLPSLSAARATDDLVRESAARFFLRNGVPLVTAISRATNGEVWGTAFERSTVEAIEGACRVRRVRLEAVAPSVAVLSRALEGDRVTWNDGDTTAEVAVRDGELGAVRRVASHNGVDGPPLMPTRLLASLGEEGWRFADALGAAIAPENVLGWRPAGRDAHALPRWRLVAASITAIAATVAWLIAPGVAASIAQAEAERRLTALADMRQSVVLAERELAQVTHALADVAAFDSGGIPATVFLADLTRAMPEGAAIVALRIAGDRGTLVLLAPRSGAVLSAVERVAGIEGAEMVGPVTSEVVGARTVERLSIRFRFSGGTKRARGGSR
jgi:hypothetical protein